MDTLIAGGTVVDPEKRTAFRADVAIGGGRISAIAERIRPDPEATVVDATGQLVVPGLVDLHSHVNWRTTPHAVNADSLAAMSGVTTWIDAGSAYPTTIEAMREHVIEKSQVRVRSLLRIGLGGAPLVPPGGIHERDADMLAAVARRHDDVVVGVKVSMGQCDLQPLRVARRAADLAGLPLMVHIAQQPPPVDDVLAMVRDGDVVTHAFTGQTMCLAGTDGHLREAARAAKERGVRFDVGHGAGSFSWAAAEKLVADDLFPDTISTDSWQVSVRGPMFDLPTCMSKFLHLGMPLVEVIRACTWAPAMTVGGQHDFGLLRPGRPADVSLLKVHEGSFPLYDTGGDVRVVKQLLTCTATYVAGRRLAPGVLEPLADWIDIALSSEGFDPNPAGGLRPAVRRFQAELEERGHTPAALAARQVVASPQQGRAG